MKNSMMQLDMNKTSAIARPALITGLSLVLMTIAAAMAMGLVFNELLNPNVNLAESSWEAKKNLFGFALFLWILILILDIIVSVGLYQVYKFKQANKAMISAGLRLIYSAILAAAIFRLLQIMFIAKSETAFEVIYTHLQSFNSIWHFGLIVFGMHLIALSGLVCKKRNFRQVLAILIWLAGIGYILSNTAGFFIDNYEVYRQKAEVVFILPMVLGEFGLALWLIFKRRSSAAFI